ncbi:C-x8-C-x5-C-x3-H type zinc finger protein [Apiospora arundinis]|uniref:C-x8-C-x5-C-x3-H type zinc finger protein n=1 Tax=Apiospora arundinis TaxID=335852 RepID=A0ABR2IHW9_9PEZI
MATNPQDVAVKFDPVAAKLFAKGFNTLDESRNKFISHLDRNAERIKALEEDAHALGKKSTKDNLELSRLQSERETCLERCSALEEENSRLKTENEDLKNAIHDGTIEDPFVAVVVDGDGAIFTDELLKDPILAVNRFKASIRAQIREIPSLPVGIPIVVRIYANLQGLAKTMNANGIITHNQMLEFVSQFNFECDYFDFVDVGTIKEAADSKIRSEWSNNMFRAIFNHYYTNKQCRRIFLAGITHDSGYQHVLKDKGDRITLVESYPAREEFKGFGLPITSFPGVFRAEVLPNSAAPKAKRQSQPQAPPPPLQTTQMEDTDATFVHDDNNSGSVNVVSPDPEHIMVKELLADKNCRRIWYNTDEFRLDSFVKYPTDHGSFKSIQKHSRELGFPGLCNGHYLGGGCHRGLSCRFDHSWILEDNELATLRYQARQIKCQVLCVDFGCWKSHNCPDRKCQQDCTYGWEMHLTGGPKSKGRKRR